MQELKYIRNALVRITLAFFGVTLLALMLPAPHSGGATITEVIIDIMRIQLVPDGARLVVLSPLDPFFSQVSIAVMLALLMCIPLLCFEIWRFVAPGLFVKEKIVVATGLCFALVLAVGGAAFAYFVLVPLIFHELYLFLPSHVEALFSLRDMVSLTAGFVAGCALLFLLPLGMAILSFAGVIPTRWWRTWARPAVLLILVASAIITPDGSGAGMVLLSLPLSVLYGLGVIASTAVGKQRSLLT